MEGNMEGKMIGGEMKKMIGIREKLWIEGGVILMKLIEKKFMIREERKKKKKKREEKKK